MKINHLFLLASLFALAFVGCGTDPIGADKEIQSSIDHAFAQSEFSNMQNMIDLEAQLSGELNKTGSTQGYFCSCSTVDVVQNSANNYTLTLDYGTGCICLDGRRRAGKLIAVFDGKWNVDGTTVTITPENYQVTGLNGTVYDFSFTHTITRAGLNNAGHFVLSVRVEDAVLSSTEGTIRWESTRNVAWTEGILDGDPSTNVYEITGSASGTSSNNVSFTVTIDEPLVIKTTCPHIVQGVLSLTPAGKLTRTLDYGDGTCDNEALLVIDTFSRTITLW